MVLRRHGLTRPPASRLTTHAQQALIDGQARADRDAGIDWTLLPAPGLDERLAQAHTVLPVSVERPGCVRVPGGSAAGAVRATRSSRAGQADDLSRWVLEHPDQFDADDLRCWRIASTTWLPLAEQQLAAGRARRAARRRVRRCPRAGERLAARPGALARRDPSDRRARRPAGPRPVRRDAARRRGRRAAGARSTCNALHAGPEGALDSAGKLAHELTRALGRPLSPGVPRDKRDRWGRLLVTRRSYTHPAARNTASSGCGSSRSRRAGSASAGSARRALDERQAQPQRGDGARRGGRRPRSSAGCRCCCPPRPPDSSRTPCGSGA